MTALARKWRPKNFDEYVGQSHVKTSLINAIENKRLHHAYLFSGTRGVGKTTVARIFAKALSCKQGISASPCNNCSNCIEINQGTFIDLIEVDAASKTKVEDTRELLEHTQFVPHSGKFKIFIIDEVHMLSNHSFNALLKTLEEPPEHVKFLLATTDPEKLPITVVSRCLHFKLLPISQDEINNHLTKVLSAENIKYEENALELIANGAKGSLRDALSSTDQMIALANSEITTEAVNKLLGLIDTDSVKKLMQNILENKKQESIERITKMYQNGTCLKKVLWQIMTLIHELLLDSFMGKSNDLADICPNWQAKSISSQKELLQYWYQIATFGIRDFDFAPTALVAMNVCIMRMLDFTKDSPAAITSNSPAPKTSNSILSNLELKGMTKAIVDSLAITEHTANKLILTIGKDKKALLTPIHTQKIKDAIQKTGYSGEITIQAETSEASSALAKAFNGSVIN